MFLNNALAPRGRLMSGKVAQKQTKNGHEALYSAYISHPDTAYLYLFQKVGERNQVFSEKLKFRSTDTQ
ncbi:MAG: hypothetical protein B6I35_07955 [Anaerolineaceae bacterium 4572_32.2]|nr:MAG: hypothetical protein B6I35_07955 [Anaerolineaceae bacterium 4572_32.2]